MKKFLFLSLIAFSIKVNAQITLENTYPTGSLLGERLSVVHLTTAGYKYVIYDTLHVKLYNLNHTIYKNITMPLTLSYANGFSVQNVSDELFNTNPTDVEYLVQYNDVNFVSHIRIYDELGNSLFSKDTVMLGGITNYTQQWVYYTPGGVKLVLSAKYPNTKAYVYSLPGILACSDCTNGIVSGLANPGGDPNSNQKVNSLSNPYPNPAINYTTIDYALPTGEKQGEIVFYDLMGKEIKRFKVDTTFSSIQVSTAEIASGTYYFDLITSGKKSEGKKLVVIK